MAFGRFRHQRCRIGDGRGWLSRCQVVSVATGDNPVDGSQFRLHEPFELLWIVLGLAISHTVVDLEKGGWCVMSRCRVIPSRAAQYWTGRHVSSGLSLRAN